MTKEFDVFKYKNTEGQKFQKAIIIKQGKEIDVDAMIQAGREDTEIYPTLEKYGCLDKLEIDNKGVYGDFREIKSLENIIEQNEKATNLWNNLPLEVREQFGNDKTRFLNEGEEWLKNKIQRENKSQETKQEAKEQTKDKDQNQNNELNLKE